MLIRIKCFLRVALGISATVVVAMTTYTAFGQTPVECKAKDKTVKVPKYKVAQKTRTVSGLPTLVILLSTKPKNFNQKDMEALTRALAQRFCHEPRLSVLIFDDQNIFYEEGVEWSFYRGDILINQETNDGHINFSTQRGKTRKEIEINLKL